MTHLTNASGQLIEQYSYSAFGVPKILSATGAQLTSSALNNRFLFQGRDWIKELSVYDYRNRMYHPGIGRFLQPDPLSLDAGDPNIYRYCNNDPINGSDPLGLGDEFNFTYGLNPLAYSARYENFMNGISWSPPSSTSSFSFTSSGGPGSSGYGLQSLFALLSPGGGRGGSSGGGSAWTSGTNVPMGQVRGGSSGGVGRSTDFATWQAAGLAGGYKAYAKLDKSGIGGPDSLEYGGLIVSRALGRTTVYNYTGPVAGEQGGVDDQYRKLHTANYLDVGSMKAPGGWTKIGWYYAHPVRGNTIPPDDKAVARAYNWVVVGLAPPPLKAGYSASQPMIEYYPPK